jgi:pilus assembly protein Flp/PilA
MVFEMHMYAEYGSGHGLPKTSTTRGITMNFLKRLWKEEEGQDLVEYALLVVLLALAATIGMKSLATAINTTFIAAGTNLTTNT